MKSKIFLFLFCFFFGFGFVCAKRLFFIKDLPEQQIVELEPEGRMGNLMFQYAAAYSYAREHDKTLYISGNLSELEKAFGLKVTYTEPDTPVYSHLPSQERITLKLVPRRFDGYDSSFDRSDYSLLRGFFQDPRFFQKYETDIRHLFSFKEQLTQKNENLIEKMTSTNSVSVHIRRGDYVQNQNYHFLIPETYYTRAANYMAARVKNPHFYIFSDDITWAKQHIHLKYPHTFVDNNQGTESYNDMRLMAACKHNIIANSSFSWWGAWLNPNPDKIIISPNIWLADNGTWIKNILPPQWIQLPVQIKNQNN